MGKTCKGAGMSDFKSGNDIINERGLKDFELIPIVARATAYNSIGKPVGNPIRVMVSLAIGKHQDKLIENEACRRVTKDEIKKNKLEIKSINKGTSDRLKDFLKKRAGKSPISGNEWKKRQIANLERLILIGESYLNSNPDEMHHTAIEGLLRIENALTDESISLRWDDLLPLFPEQELIALINEFKECLFKVDDLSSFQNEEQFSDDFRSGSEAFDKATELDAIDKDIAAIEAGKDPISIGHRYTILPELVKRKKEIEDWFSNKPTSQVVDSKEFRGQRQIEKAFIAKGLGPGKWKGIYSYLKIRDFPLRHLERGKKPLPVISERELDDLSNGVYPVKSKKT